MHLQPVFAEHPSHLNGSSEQLFERGLTLPSGSALSSEQTARIDEAIRSFLEARRA
jgi:dTDP-4-amino-4,6-dideoxygalactose transaminase